MKKKKILIVIMAGVDGRQLDATQGYSSLLEHSIFCLLKFHNHWDNSRDKVYTSKTFGLH